MTAGEDSLPHANACRVGAYGAGAALVGVVLSGPLAVVLVEVTRPQPAWRGAALFAANFDRLQLLPYLGGIVLVGGLVALLASVHAIARPKHKAFTATALVFTAIFGALIFFNYIVQTTFLPAIAEHYSEEDAPIVAALSMTNPRSLAWALEMWGWACFGAATWLASGVFGGSTLERAVAATFFVNGPLCLLGAILSVMHPGWMMSGPGLTAYATWNVLLASMVALALVALQRRRRAGAPMNG